MTRLICITSGKGGVGKTTLSANLAAALARLGEDVIVVDGNLTTPDLGLHLGLHLVPNTLHDVLQRRVKLQKAIYKHPLGFRVIVGSPRVADLKGIDASALPEITLNLLGRSDFVILDSAAGLGAEAMAAIEAADEVLIVTNPELPAVMEALKTIKVIDKKGKKILGVILNRVDGSGLKANEIENILEVPIIGEVPEDVNVPRSVEARQPVVELKPGSPAAQEIKDIARKLVRKVKPRKKGLLRRFLDWLFRR